MPNLKPLMPLKPLAPLAPAPVPSRPVSILTPLPFRPLSELTGLPARPAPSQSSSAPQPAAAPKPLPPAKSPAASQIWDLQAAVNLLQSDSNYDGTLNPDEYKQISLVQGDGFFSTRARDYEFAVVDEIKFADGQVSMGELASFYQQMDSDKNGRHSQPEFETRLNRSNWLTRLRHPIASFSHLISEYTNLVKGTLGFS